MAMSVKMLLEGEQFKDILRSKRKEVKKFTDFLRSYAVAYSRTIKAV